MTEAVAVERRIVSVLFADLVGFTTLSEQLEPEDVATVQDAYFAAVRETVGRYGGVLEKFIGDAAMAVFGAPRAREDDAERAVRAGLALVSAVEQLGARLGLSPGILRLRVGINSGEVVHATDGPDAGRVTGDTVNTAARLQTAARPDSVLVGELTALTVEDSIELAEPVPIELKGKAVAVLAREAVAARPEPSRDDALGALHAPLLGRSDELARLEALLAAGQAARATIVAPPGVGKSRLVAELATRAEAGGVVVLRARARPHPGAPFEAVAQLLAAAGARESLDATLDASAIPAARRSVVRHEVASLLAPSLLAGDASVKDLAAERETRFAAWSAALDALAGGTPSLWIVEDVHWAGPDILAFLAHAAAESVARRRVVLATARPSLLESAPDWVAAGEVLELSTLPAADAAALVVALVGDALPQQLVTAIAERSDGNPLFVEELLRTWVSVRTLVSDPTDGTWRLAVAPIAVVLPATVQAIYAAQLDDLPADARLVARRASVAGRRFATDAFEALGLAEQRSGLDVLRRRAFVSGPQPDAFGEIVFAYRHALLRDAGYASLARLERARLHAALAMWLDDSAGERRAEVAQFVAQHYADALVSLPSIGATGEGLSRSHLASRAAAAFELGATTAVGLAAHEEAVRLLRRAIEHTAPDDAVDLARRRLRLGEILADVADLDEGIAEMSAACEGFAAALPDAAAAYAEAAYRLGVALMQQIRFADAEALSRAALERLGGRDAPGTLRLHALHAWSLGVQGRDEGAVDEVREARRGAAKLGDPSVELDVLEHYAATLDELDQPDRDAWAQMEERARELGRWRQVAIAARIRSILTADDRPEDALPILAEAADITLAHGLTEQQGWIELARCETLWVLGRWDEALESAGRAITLGERYAYDRLTFRTWMVVLPLVAARRDAGWLPRYEQWWGVAEQRIPPSPSAYGAMLRAVRPRWLALARGGRSRDEQPPDSETARLVAPMSNAHLLAAIVDLVEWWLEAGAVAAASIAADRLRAAVDAGDSTPLVRASSALVDAWVARADGRADDSPRAAERALAEARSVGAPWWELRAADVLGEDTTALRSALGMPSP